MKRFTGCILLLFLSFSLFPFAARADTGAPLFYGKAAALYQAENEEFLFSENADMRLPMASTTKIMTALLAIENADCEDIVSVPSEAFGVEGSSLYLAVGDTGRLLDLLYALMLNSANDVAVTLAIHVSGSLAGFIDLMNSRAAELGLTGTHFMNPHGLHDDNHYTTAHDLALLTAEALRNPIFEEIVKTEHKVIRLNDGETVRTLKNHNRLLSSYDGMTGVKTGFTRRAGRCLVTAARRNGITFIAVTLSCPDDWQVHKSLLDFGFSSVENTCLTEKGMLAFRVPVLGGEISYVTISNPSAVYAVVKKDADIETRFDILPYPTAPIKKGAPLGKVTFLLNGKPVAETVLTAESRVSPVKNKRGFFGLF